MLLQRRHMLFACPNEMSNLGPDKFVLNGTKCRQARMKIARHGAAAECRVGKRDDLSPALAGRLNRSLQKVTASESEQVPPPPHPLTLSNHHWVTIMNNKMLGKELILETAFCSPLSSFLFIMGSL